MGVGHQPHPQLCAGKNFRHGQRLNPAEIVTQKSPIVDEARGALRWYLRGLPVPIVVRKVQVDVESAANRRRGK